MILTNVSGNLTTIIKETVQTVGKAKSKTIITKGNTQSKHKK